VMGAELAGAEVMPARLGSQDDTWGMAVGTAGATYAGGMGGGHGASGAAQADGRGASREAQQAQHGGHKRPGTQGRDSGGMAAAAWSQLFVQQQQEQQQAFV